MLTKYNQCFLVVFIIILSLFVAPSKIYASDFKTDYDVQYFVNDVSSLQTQVSFHVKITNLKPDLYIPKFSILFPKSFQIGNIKASDDYGPINQTLTQEGNKSVVTMEFSNPQAGLQVENNLYLDFLQTNLFKASGNVWEVILPTIDRKDNEGGYTVTVNLPPHSNKQIGIAKPKPTLVTLDKIMWQNPESKTIYAVFGKEQNYELQLRYTLKNPRITRVYTDVAFPPDTLYQKVFVSSISPKPDNVTYDEDGNYLGRFFLNPQEEKTIVFNGSVTVYAEPRVDMEKLVEKRIHAQEKYLLSATDYWNLNESQIPSNLKNIKDIYDYTLSTLTYNYGRLNTDITRLGASKALALPDQAVCTEFSDVFISLARERGYLSREIQGYGFSTDQDLRPLSINQDILHSWPEYYDQARGLWIQLDPTWESTSGIDYHSSFDLNHIAFAIHGKKADYPYPAGSYKVHDDAKDINIAPVARFDVEHIRLHADISPLQVPVSGKNTYATQVKVTNLGNTMLINTPITFISKDIQIVTPHLSIETLLPYQSVTLQVEYVNKSIFTTKKATIEVVHDGAVIETASITLGNTYYMYAIIGGAAVLFILFTIFIIRKKQS